MTVSATFEVQSSEMSVQVENASLVKNGKSQILYKVEDKPPLFLSILLGFQVL
jgi:hypothetical protein